MKKLVFSSILLFGIASKSNAQTERHNFMVGSNLLTSSVSFQSGNTGFDLALQPKVGYFINDNLAIGLAAELGVNAVKSNLTMNYGLTPFARIFVGKKSIEDIPRRVMFFVEAGGGFGGRNSRFTDASGNKTNVTSNGGVFYVSPGVDLFLNKNVAFEVGLEYRYIGGAPSVNRVGLNLGFQIFLAKSQAKKVYRETEKDMK